MPQPAEPFHAACARAIQEAQAVLDFTSHLEAPRAAVAVLVRYQGGAATVGEVGTSYEALGALLEALPRRDAIANRKAIPATRCVMRACRAALAPTMIVASKEADEAEAEAERAWEGLDG
jgi:hypothetical protein